MQFSSSYVRKSELTKMNHSPMRGIESDVAGILSDTISKKTQRDRRTVIPSEIFSPDSGGRQKTRSAIAVMSTQGMTRLKK